MNMRVFLLMMILTEFSFAQPSPNAQDWKVRKEENGITVYSRHEDGVSIDEIKVVNTVHASLSAIVAVLLDVPHYPDWIFRCTEGKILKEVSDSEQYQYQVNDGPYPVSDRDVVVHFTVWQDPKTKIVYTHSVGVPDYIPKDEDAVRMPLFDGGYQLIPLGNGDVQVVYTLMLDPGGSIPDWIVNKMISSGPYETQLKMKGQVEKAEYQNQKFSFIKD